MQIDDGNEQHMHAIKEATPVAKRCFSQVTTANAEAVQPALKKATLSASCFTTKDLAAPLHSCLVSDTFAAVNEAFAALTDRRGAPCLSFALVSLIADYAMEGQFTIATGKQTRAAIMSHDLKRVWTVVNLSFFEKLQLFMFDASSLLQRTCDFFALPEKPSFAVDLIDSTIFPRAYMLNETLVEHPAKPNDIFFIFVETRLNGNQTHWLQRIRTPLLCATTSVQRDYWRIPVECSTNSLVDDGTLRIFFTQGHFFLLCLLCSRDAEPLGKSETRVVVSVNPGYVFVLDDSLRLIEKVAYQVTGFAPLAARSWIIGDVVEHVFWAGRDTPTPYCEAMWNDSHVKKWVAVRCCTGELLHESQLEDRLTDQLPLSDSVWCWRKTPFLDTWMRCDRTRPSEFQNSTCNTARTLEREARAGFADLASCTRLGSGVYGFRFDTSYQRLVLAPLARQLAQWQQLMTASRDDQ